MGDSDLLRCLLHVIGRAVIPDKKVRALIGRAKNGLKAFNLLDGVRTITEVSKKTKINQGNLSRLTSRWVDSGIAFRIGEGLDERVLHVYPIPEKPPKEQQ